MKSYSCTTKKAFTLIEVVVSVFLFLLLMLAIVSVFGNTILGYHTSRDMQRDVENAQFAMNLVAKTLRTSTVVSAEGNVDTVRLFDHSQGICFEFYFDNSTEELYVARPPAHRPILEHQCENAPSSSLSDVTKLTTGKATGAFYVITSRRDDSGAPGYDGSIGRITLSLTVSPAQTGRYKVQDIQTTTSLRDYQNVGLFY